MDFHEFILFFVFLPLQTRAEGLRKGQSRFRGTSLVGSFRWGDEYGGAEVALGMPLPDGLQQES